MMMLVIVISIAKNTGFRCFLKCRQGIMVNVDWPRLKPRTPFRVMRRLVAWVGHEKCKLGIMPVVNTMLFTGKGCPVGFFFSNHAMAIKKKLRCSSFLLVDHDDAGG